MSKNVHKKECPSDYDMNPGLPIQQIETDGEFPTDKEIRTATKDINPDINSYGSRG
ncbi:MAG: hypothetical protein NC206_02350 [Bacteroides sp.]|nr:hypothetical protein [Roseburia sp.]MCM1345905.1 hypothetical protein [Bacteroides sp.]MCM1421378.1 hypothetical protein [Bacteroides sp.]